MGNVKFLISVLVCLLGHVIILNITYQRREKEKIKNLSLKVRLIQNKAQKNHLHKAPTSIKSPAKKLELANLGLSFNIKNPEPVSIIGKFGTRQSTIGKAAEGSLYYILYQKIADNTTYPQVLINHNIQGVSRARLVFDKKGHYQVKLSKFESNSNYLKVHLSQLIRSIFKTPLNFKVLNSNFPYLIIDLVVIFGLPGQYDEDFIRDHSYINDNYISLVYQPGNAPSMVQMFATQENIGTPGMKGISVDIMQLINKINPSDSKVDNDSLRKFQEDPAW